MKVNVRRASDYIRQMERREPWLGNLLGHEPDRRGDWEAATLGVELEQALMREDPVLHGSLERGLSTRLDAFFLELARGLLASRPRSDLERSKLAGIVRSEVPGR